MLKFCPYCGAEILRQDVKFCMSCGKSLAEFMNISSTPEPPAQKPLPNVSAKKSVRKPSDSTIEQELAKCRESAEEGFKLAAGKYNEIKDTLIAESRNLSQTDAEQNEIERIQNTELVDTQKKDLRQLTNRVKLIRDDIKALRERSKDFSIVVYGRTMAGKSTLMEILTHGNGKSIGKGSQRTTRDVRDYYWNGLKITDVPGICAFEGAEDERLAMEAAKAADLILFLLTSDAPQPDEAACLAQLKSFGKPVLGVINVKMNFNINDELDIEDLQDKLSDMSSVDATLQQFKQFATSHNQDWSGIKFVATHLLSAYQAQDKNPKVFEISRFVEVEDFILDKVRNDGRFLRIKTFADSVSVPMSDIILKIYEHSATALLESDIWFNKRQQLSEWREKFLQRSQTKLDNLYEQLSEQLDAAIYNFAENHYEDDKVNEHWQQRLQSLHFDQQYQMLLKDFADECERKRKELSDELTQELSYAFHGNTKTSIKLEGTTPWGKYASALVGLAGFAFPPLRIASMVVGILGQFFFDGKEKKIREAKAKLRDGLTMPSYEMLDKMHNQVVEIFNKEILAKGIDEFHDLLCGYQFMLARLGKSQGDLANTLFWEFSDLNTKLFAEAIEYKGAGFISSVNGIARVPGELMVVFADRSNLNTAELSDLLGEKISVTNPAEELSDTVKNILNSDFDVDFYPTDFDKDDEKSENAVAVFPKSKVNATNLKIAQQIAGVPIITNVSVKNNYTPPPQPQNNQSTKLKRSAKSGTIQFIPSGKFSEDLKKIKSAFNSPSVSNEFISDALDAIEQLAKQQRNQTALNFVAEYREKLRRR